MMYRIDDPAQARVNIGTCVARRKPNLTARCERGIVHNGVGDAACMEA